MEDQAALNADDDDNNNNNNVDLSVSAALDSQEQTVKKRKERPWENEVHENMQTSSSMPSTESSVKRRKGRTHGTGRLQQIASIGGYVAETAGGSFTPHVMTVNTGEDVVSKISALFQKGPRAACIFSATGVVSSVVIRRPGSSNDNDTLRFEGLFEVLSLSGSYTYQWDGSSRRRSRKGMLSISLAHSDGRVFGGALDGPLIAAGPIQLIVACFEQNISKKIMRMYSAGSSAAPDMSSDPDLEWFYQNVPRMLEGEQSCPSPTSGLVPTTNVQPQNIIATTTAEASNNIIPANQNMHSASADDVGLDSQTMQAITDKRNSADDNGSVKFSSG